MNIIFFGNTRFSLIGARIIQEKLGLSLIVTLPDRPDKKGVLTPNPLKTFAVENKIPYLLIDKIINETISQVAEYKPDFLIVEDYGLILPDKLLNLPKYASLNIHHSLLPHYRGPSPAPFAILAGDKITGVSVIAMNDEVDAGDILAQKEYEMKSDETTESLLTELNKLGGEIIIPVIQEYISGNAKPQKQDESLATDTERMSKSDGQIDIDNLPSKDKLDRMIRAYHPWPGVWGKWQMANGKWQILKFLPYSVCHPERSEGSHKPDSSAMPQNDKGFCIQVEGGRPMNIKDFINGYPEMQEIIETMITP